MIQEIRIKNYLSFRDEVTLSFEATKDTAFDDCQVVEVAPKVRLLRFALIYGSNASGKSNLLSALSFLRKFWHWEPTSVAAETGVSPFLLDKITPTAPSEFHVKFYVGGVKYGYNLTIDGTHIIEEQLYVYASAQPSRLFLRTWNDGQSEVRLNSSLVKASEMVVEQLNVKCLPNMSFIAVRGQVNCSLPYIDDAVKWMTNGIMPVVLPDAHMFNFAEKQMASDMELKSYLLDFVQAADYNIIGIDTHKEIITMPEGAIAAIQANTTLPQKMKEEMLAQGSIEQLSTDFKHTVSNARGKEIYSLPEYIQSMGTRRTIGVEAAIYKAMKEGALLPIDEIEASLHPEILEFMLTRFLAHGGRSQMVATTHYDPLLDTTDDLLRKDSVWFTDKGKDGHTSVYSLSDFKGLSKVRSKRNAYRGGAFGALPNVKG